MKTFAGEAGARPRCHVTNGGVKTLHANTWASVQPELDFKTDSETSDAQ